MINKISLIFPYIFFVLIMSITLLNQRQNIVVYPASILIIFSLFIFIRSKNYTFKNTIVIKSTLLYVFILFSIINHPINVWYENIILSISPLVIFQTAFYFFNKYELINSLIKFVIIIAIFASYKVYFVTELLVNNYSNSLQTNWGNVLGACLPVVFLIKQKKMQLLVLILFGIFIIIGLKRTAILSFIITSVIFTFFRIRDNKLNFNLFYSLIVLSMSLAVFSYINIDNSKLEFASNRMSNVVNDGGSGRGEIYSQGFNTWLEKVPFHNKIFGYGYNGYSNHSNTKYGSAHNDFIDFLYDYGFFSAFLLLYMYLHLIYISIKLFQLKSTFFLFVFATTLIFLVYSFFAAAYHYFFFFSPLILFISLSESFYFKSIKKKYF